MVSFQVTKLRQEEKWKIDFDHHVEKASLALRGRLEVNRQILHLLRSLFYASKHVDRDEFKIFASQIIKSNGGIRALEWVPRVKAEHYFKYKQQAIRDGFPQFETREKTADGNFVTAASRPEYFPVFYIEPMRGNEKAFGFDMASDPTRFESMVTARDKAEAVATKKVHLVQDEEEHAGVLIFLPVYEGNNLPKDPGGRRVRLKGFVLGVYRVGDLVENVLAPIIRPDMELAIFQGDEDNPEDFLFKTLSPERKLESREVLNFFGQDWQLVWQGDASGPNQYFPHLIAGMVLVFGFLFAIAFELNFSRLQVKTLVENTVDGIITMDQNSIIRSFNPAAEKMFGYKEEEVVGRKVGLLMPVEFVNRYGDGLERYLKTGDKRIIGTLVEIIGRKKNGQEFPIEIGVAEFKRMGNRIFTGTIRDITDRKKLENELEALSQTDGLTGIDNRRSFDINIEKEWNRASRNQEPLSLILMDIDYFKKYNDTYGHVEGDECLKKVAAGLGSSLNRASDFLGRYGGEEFVAILPGIASEKALEIAENIRKTLINLKIEHASSDIGDHLTISLGVATIINTKDRKIEVLVKAADKALYEAKQKGRNQSVAVLI
ncbi:MAG: diguanylate cyclase [Candidatus Nitronauta litoralis]|uniref:diguanylate cyclase n=1 Tax=Candidatus Nitronauta litoralis TaxID=2705533 RepID=A0A7T0BW01_9BACT|nr:MAG: diguanylate cyclase [Candidatus Nitronauta litoralis]